MDKRRNVMLDADKFLSRDKIRIGLLLSSLYLAAFEILKTAITEGVKDRFVFLEEPSIVDELTQQMKDLAGRDIAASAFKEYKKQVEEYEQEVKVKFDERDQKGLIPSCEWLRNIGVLNQTDVEEVRRIRKHRNEIAHELPSILVGTGFEVDLTFFAQIRSILRKIETFYAQSDLLFDPVTLEEVTLDDDQLENLQSSRQVILEQIIETVIEYLDQSGANANVPTSNQAAS